MTTATGSDSTTRADGGPVSPISGVAELFEICALLQKLSLQETEYSQASAEVVAHRRGEAEVFSEWMRRFETSLREIRSHVDSLGAALDRIRIVALNTGLEGARLGDLAGRALVSVSDELRALTSRGLELLSEQMSTVERMEADRQRIEALTEHGQTQLSELELALREILSAERLSHEALSRLAAALQHSTGLDVEAAARLGQISEQARGLVESLTDVSRLAHQDAVRAALLPALEPLVSWISCAAESKP